LAGYTTIVKGGKVIGLVAAEYDSATLADFQDIVRRAFFVVTVPAVLISLLIACVLASTSAQRIEVLREIQPSGEELKILEGLTPRETDVAKLLGEGKSNPQIAEKLTMSVETVKTHVKSILQKKGCSRFELGWRVRDASIIDRAELKQVRKTRSG